MVGCMGEVKGLGKEVVEEEAGARGDVRGVMEGRCEEGRKRKKAKAMKNKMRKYGHPLRRSTVCKSNGS